MIDPDDTLESASSDLIEARAKIDAARKVLQDALDAQDGDLGSIRQAMARLDRIAAEMGRIEGVIAELPVASPTD